MHGFNFMYMDYLFNSLLYQWCWFFFSAAAAPYLTYLVPNHRRKRLNAINGTLQSGAIVIGPAVTGLIVHMTGRVSLALWLDAGTFVLSALSLLILPGVKIRTDNAAEKQDGVFSIWLIDLKSAIQVLKQRIFFTILLTLVTTFGTLGAATDSQEVVFARLALGLSSGDYSLLVTIAGIGYIMGAIFVTILANRLSLRVLISIGSIFTSCGFVLYAFSHSFILAAIGFIILGIFQSFSNAGFSTFYQISIPPEYMGRVLNITSPLTQVMTVLMTITGGLVASLIGVRLMTIGATLLVSLVSIVIVLTIISPRAKGAFRSVEVQS
ncbi:MFS transporter [Alicyclobacillus sacchari]|uniref:MFS transporter n=1 Tax=Alicyclobacillus sacchari TaxID=392010 RepID=UPI0024E11594|nr:MFS transporter [Alicyclobacillus sacchari]